jgi:hypothetical protein
VQAQQHQQQQKQVLAAPESAQWEAERLLLEQELHDAETKAAKTQRELQQALAEKDAAADKAVLLQLQLQEAGREAAGDRPVGGGAEQRVGGVGGLVRDSASSRDWKLQELERLQEEKRLLTDKVWGTRFLTNATNI